MIVNSRNFSRSSSTYNNILAFAATAVENDAGGGFVHSTQGDNCVTMNGRTFHFLPAASNVNPTGGLAYCIFDLPDGVRNHADTVNGRHNGRFCNVNEFDLRCLHEELMMFHPFARQLRIAGMEANNNARAIVPVWHEQLMVTEVASLTADSAVGERILHVSLANQSTHNISLRHRLSEPLCYPLLFTNFEIGWGEKVIQCKLNAIKLFDMVAISVQAS
jgi:hypothetical protein